MNDGPDKLGVRTLAFIYLYLQDLWSILAVTISSSTVPHAEKTLQRPVNAPLLLQLMLLAVCAHLCACVYLCADLSHTKCHTKSKHPHTRTTAKS